MASTRRSKVMNADEDDSSSRVSSSKSNSMPPKRGPDDKPQKRPSAAIPSDQDRAESSAASDGIGSVPANDRNDVPPLAYPERLSFETINAAHAHFRFPKEVVPTEGTDNAEEIEKDPERVKSYVKRILRACMSALFEDQPESSDISPTHWQSGKTKLERMMRKRLPKQDKGQTKENFSDKDYKRLELMVWMLLSEIFDVQKQGITAQAQARVEDDPTAKLKQMKCSERIERVITAIRTLPNTAIDVLKGERHDILAAAPEFSIKQKTGYRSSNMRKADEANKGKTARKTLDEQQQAKQATGKQEALENGKGKDEARKEGTVEEGTSEDEPFEDPAREQIRREGIAELTELIRDQDE
ncbi:hypothetical protein CKM354_000510200 [Cercospora kikuchii]|uniref:Uncharacterized protein n=1 Tax=Cercospora kikuchii TaxID=84275 RepID=A0A9P3CF75_9PEZI|nr:uncharacterized protein CKM354_000510200 [Cercospora kikuchii]GIZ41809.1 hypothetical protein CKM354_000510200 [Cercospora kikuchii]